VDLGFQGRDPRLELGDLLGVCRFSHISLLLAGDSRISEIFAGLRRGRRDGSADTPSGLSVTPHGSPEAVNGSADTPIGWADTHNGSMDRPNVRLDVSIESSGVADESSGLPDEP
jgi:hypothetical protein